MRAPEVRFFNHNSAKALDRVLRKRDRENALVLIEGIYSLDGDEANIQRGSCCSDHVRHEEARPVVCDDDRVRLDHSETPEFDRWRWVDFWRPVKEVIYFKRRVYAQALYELGPHLYPDGLPPQPRWWPSR